MKIRAFLYIICLCSCSEKKVTIFYWWQFITKRISSQSVILDYAPNGWIAKLLKWIWVKISLNPERKFLMNHIRLAQSTQKSLLSSQELDLPPLPPYMCTYVLSTSIYLLTRPVFAMLVVHSIAWRHTRASILAPFLASSFPSHFLGKNPRVKIDGKRVIRLMSKPFERTLLLEYNHWVNSNDLILNTNAKSVLIHRL